jgi:hypothetical protein
MLGGSRAATGRGEEAVLAVEGAVVLSGCSGWGVAWLPPVANAGDYGVGGSLRTCAILSPP